MISKKKGTYTKRTRKKSATPFISAQLKTHHGRIYRFRNFIAECHWIGLCQDAKRKPEAAKQKMKKRNRYHESIHAP